MVFVNHGENTVTDSFAELVGKELGCPTAAPDSGAEFDLLADKFLSRPEGVPVSKPTVGGANAEDYFKRLSRAGESLMALIREAKGRPNKTLQAFLKDVDELLRKYR